MFIAAIKALTERPDSIMQHAITHLSERQCEHESLYIWTTSDGF